MTRRERLYRVVLVALMVLLAATSFLSLPAAGATVGPLDHDVRNTITGAVDDFKFIGAP